KRPKSAPKRLRKAGKFQAMPAILHAIHLNYAHALAPCSGTNSTSTQAHDWPPPKRMPQRQDYVYAAWSMTLHALLLWVQRFQQSLFASSTTSHAPFSLNCRSPWLKHSQSQQYDPAHHAKYRLVQKAATGLHKHEPLLYLVPAMKPVNRPHRLIAQ